MDKKQAIEKIMETLVPFTDLLDELRTDGWITTVTAQNNKLTVQVTRQEQDRVELPLKRN